MRRFFIDSAHAPFIQSVLDVLKSNGLEEHFIGLTTNPKILDRANINDTNFVSEIVNLQNRFIRRSNQEIYVQIPSSTLTPEELRNWVDSCLSKFPDDMWFGVKLPPVAKLVNALFEYTAYSINITGITHYQQLLDLPIDYISYASYLFGRMEEVGLDPESEVQKTYQKIGLQDKLISGSLRTLDGLKRSFDLGMVPTIGTTAWDAIKDNVDAFVEMVKVTDPAPVQDAVVLSTNFFAEMDNLASKLNLKNA